MPFLADDFSSAVLAVSPPPGLLLIGPLSWRPRSTHISQRNPPFRIIPTNETPGAREAGVVYFIDRALATFASKDRGLYSEGVAERQARSRELFPSVDKFSAATTDQQDEILRSLDTNAAPSDRPFRPRPLAQNFFETLRQHTILGFLIDPDADRRGNRDGVGWQVIGREREHMFRPPFGFYDKDYPGWQPAAVEPEKK